MTKAQALAKPPVDRKWHMTPEVRVHVMARLNAGVPRWKIAKELNRDRNVLARELRACGLPGKRGRIPSISTADFIRGLELVAQGRTWAAAAAEIKARPSTFQVLANRRGFYAAALRAHHAEHIENTKENTP